MGENYSLLKQSYWCEFVGHWEFNSYHISEQPRRGWIMYSLPHDVLQFQIHLTNTDKAKIMEVAGSQYMEHCVICPQPMQIAMI